MANENTNNSFTAEAADIFKTLTGAAQGAADVYSTFLNARSVLEVSKGQRARDSNASTYSPEQEDILSLGNNAVTYVVYAAIALAVVGTGALIYRAVKK